MTEETNQQDDLVGNTDLTEREFIEIIKTKTTAQLQTKRALGITLRDNLVREGLDEGNLKKQLGAQSMNQQVRIIERELQRRYRRLGDDDAEFEGVRPRARKTRSAGKGPLDQVVGMKTISLSGKTGLGQ